MKMPKYNDIDKFEDDINSQLSLKMGKMNKIPLKSDTQNIEEFLNEKTSDGIEKSGFKSTILPMSNLNSENKILHESMGTIELCYDSDSDIDTDIIAEGVKKEMSFEDCFDEELPSIKIESIMTLKDCSIRLNGSNIHNEHEFNAIHKVELKILPCKIYECEVCSKVFCTLKSLEAHKFNIHDMEEIMKKFDLNDDFGSITDIKVSKTNDRISDVGRDVLTNINVENNMINESEEMQNKLFSIFVPKEIQASYDNDKDFENKMEIVTDFKIEEFDINENMESVSNEMIFNSEILEEFNFGNLEESIQNKSCKSCDKTFNSLNSINEHIENIDEIKREFKCYNCEKMFSSKQSLRYHNEADHEGLKKYSCNICKKSFRTKQNLNIHIETIHEGRKTFGDAGKFKRHFRDIHIADVHEGLNAFECEKCGKCYSTNQVLINHMKLVHKKQRNFKCNNCEKIFQKKQSLKHHIESFHEGKRKFSCEFCGKTFVTHQGIRFHIKTIHEGIRYHCDFCKKCFTQLQNLKNHMNKKHNNTTQHENDPNILNK